ncbi:MAG: response regulator [Candidatus Auribacterota bacterium]|jgi:DNA-binding NtrC family response regulator|uniref:Response regulator n=1 Tax=Candidatus Auribacter fodinae TaxID=2093366 RepID=A0A3A4R768_9BACT|nr:MAG: response regulator [Candidatus Auribacter fodinae]
MNEKKILVIDDDKNVALMLQNYFEALDIKTFIAVELENVLDLIENEQPDLIFLDYRMKPHTGKDFLERFKILNITIPVIMMSAYKRRDGIFEMKRLGAVEYIDKPYNFELIDELLIKYLKFNPKKK